MPDIYGSTTLSAAAVAMAASMALPPSIRMRMPAREARGWAEAIMPRRPVAVLRCVVPLAEKAIGRNSLLFVNLATA